MKIMKFGGTSVKDANRIRALEPILSQETLEDGLVVVCSAMKGVTDDLIRAATQASLGDDTWRQTLQAISQRHQAAVVDLFGRDDVPIWAELKAQLAELEEICHGVYLIRECSLRTMDFVMGFGERLNNQLIAAWFAHKGWQAHYVDARKIIRTNHDFGSALVDFPATYQLTRTWFDALWSSGPRGQLAFVTGFVASTEDGISTTLGRNGSDYTASIVGAGLGVTDIEIWTDVDGVLSCDPRIVPQAFVIPDLSVDEAMEMSYFGAEVLHPYTMIPAVEKNIPLWIKNTMNPGARGTRIAKDVPPSPYMITGIAVIKQAALINVVGGGMVGAKGTASKIFGALARVETNVIMISQASSEHSICVVVRQSEAPTAVAELNRVLADALAKRSIQSIDLVQDLEILSVIGANMRGRPGVAGTLFNALGAERINILAIAQGSGEMNISCVIEAKDRVRAMAAIHRAFFPEEHP